MRCALLTVSNYSINAILRFGHVCPQCIDGIPDSKVLDKSLNIFKF